MDIIKSNRQGKGIHSPFVYRLVTNIIFAPYPYYSFIEIEKFSDNKRITDEYKKLFRLIHFIYPYRIQIIGNDYENLKKICMLANKNICIEEIDTYQFKKESNNEDYMMRIWDSIVPKLVSLQAIRKPECWIIKGTGKRKLIDFFKLLRNKNKVQVTINLDQWGIAIFNDKFQYEDYVIKH